MPSDRELDELIDFVNKSETDTQIHPEVWYWMQVARAQAKMIQKMRSLK